MSKHTPGKWKMDEHGRLMAGTVQIAAVFPRDREANGALFENAPELYQVVKDLQAKLGCLFPSEERVDTIAALLSRIEGVAP